MIRLQAALAGRDYLGIELEAGYCELARRRLSGATRYLQRRNAATGRECTAITA